MKLPPLAMGALGGLVLAAALAPAAGTALGKLASARAERAKLTEELAAPESNAALVAPGLALTGGEDSMIARVRERARGSGVLVEEAKVLNGAGSLLVVRLRVSGPEKAVIALADSLEREAPLVRLRTWKLEAISGGVRLTAEALASIR